MKINNSSFQVKFWALVGPLICSMAFLVIFLNGSSTPFFLPLALTAGIPICWRFKLWGFLACSLFIFGNFYLYYGTIPLEERFWDLGMGAAVLLSLLITTLAYEEVEVLVESLIVESNSRLENLWKVDAKQKCTEVELNKKKEEIKELQIKVRSFQKLIDMSTDELVEAKTNMNRALQELYQVRTAKAHLQESLVKTSSEPPAEAKLNQLRQQFEEKQKVLDNTRRDLFLTKEKLYRLQKEHEELKIYGSNEMEQLLERHLIQMANEQEKEERERDAELMTLEHMVSEILTERERP